MILPFIAVLAIGTLVVILWWFAAQGARQRELDRIVARRHAELLRTRQLQRRAEARINRLVTDTMQQMTQAAASAPHSHGCLCGRCIGNH